MPQSKRKEVEIINMLSDRVYNIEDRLDGFCKAIDKFVDIFRSELKKKAAGYLKTLIIDYKYKAEHLRATFDSSTTSCRDAEYTCVEARKGSRMLALHSGIEDPPSAASQPLQLNSVPTSFGSTVSTTSTGTSSAPHDSNSSAVPQKASFRQRMMIEDDEDAAYQAQQQQRRQVAAQEAARQAALEAQKAPDFGFEFSIDAKKRELGAAVELLAMPTKQDWAQDDGTQTFLLGARTVFRFG